MNVTKIIFGSIDCCDQGAERARILAAADEGTTCIIEVDLIQMSQDLGINQLLVHPIF